MADDKKQHTDAKANTMECNNEHAVKMKLV